MPLLNTVPPITLTCHCTHTSIPLELSSLPPLQLPIEATYSHLPEHTKLTGSPFTLLFPLDVPAEDTFCSTCGTTLSLTHDDQAYGLVGALRPENTTPVVVTGHIGAVGNIGKLIDDGLEKVMAEEEEEAETTDTLNVNGACGCGALKIEIKKPTEPSRWLFETEKGRMFGATLCFCTTCRHTSGGVGMGWMFIPVPLLTVTGDLGEYQSSEGVKRKFCKSCGAGVMYQDDKAKGEMVDIAIGLLGKEWRGWCVVAGEGGGEGEGIREYIEGWGEGRFSYETDGEGLPSLGGVVEAVRRGMGKTGW